MSTEIIRTPKNKGLKQAYISILKMFYIEQRDTFFFHDYVYAVQSDCGISAETAVDRCKQLDKLNILSYVDSGLSGHIYRCHVYAKIGEKIIHIDNLAEATRLIETEFSEEMETEFLQIKKMNIQAKPSVMRFDKTEAELVFKATEIAQPIKEGKDDVIKASFVTDRISNEQVCDAFIANLTRNAIPDETEVSLNSPVETKVNSVLGEE
jgi:hypothetical protein